MRMDETLSIIRGDDESIAITIKDTNGSSLLKAGDTLFLTVKKTISDTDEDAIYSDDVTLGSDTDEYSYDLSNTETELPIGKYIADVQWKNGSGKIKTIYRGNFEVGFDVTRRKVPKT